MEQGEVKEVQKAGKVIFWIAKKHPVMRALLEEDIYAVKKK